MCWGVLVVGGEGGELELERGVLELEKGVLGRSKGLGRVDE